MKVMKKLATLLLAGALAATAALPAFAGPTTEHTLKITTNGEGSHTYGAYQIFKGNLDATGEKLSNVEWGSAITDNGAGLIAAIKKDTTLYGEDKTFQDDDLTSAEKVAAALSGAANNGDVAKAFADAVNDALGNATTTTSATTSEKVATIKVIGDGYYFVKDTGNIANTDTATRFVLEVVGDINVTAKDTVLTPDKEIVAEDDTTLDPTKDNDASIGDVITYKVTIPVPDTRLYKDHFVLEMTDTLENGLTYFGNMTIKIDTDPETTLTDNTDYTTTVTNGQTAFTVPTVAADAVTTAGGQTIKVLFNGFKTKAEANNNAWLGKTITISYQVVLNDDATYGSDSNDNKVHFKYSNNPNYNYDGDNPGPEDVMGTTPDSTTETFVTTLELDKVDGANTSTGLAGAEFSLTGTTWKNVLVTGEKFEETGYSVKDGETILEGTYYRLTDGSYTTTQKNDQTAAQYETGDKTYVKVTFENVVKTPGSVEMKVITDESGHIIVKGIEQGTYTLKETKAPTGYNLDETEYKLVIDWTNPKADNASDKIKAAGGFSIGANTSDGFVMDDNGAKFHITITNNSGSQLPSTGGMGTTLFYVIGGLLIVAAAIVIISKRRVQEG